MTKVPASRTTERTAVNETRALLERHGHIVQEVEGGSDFGEDLYVSFVRNGRRTGDLIAVQVKGGLSFRRASGYAVSTKKHADDWRISNVPVVCVVYDPDMKKLYWANASQQLRVAKADGKAIRSIRVGESDVLDDRTVDDFVRDVRRYIEISDARARDGFKEAQRRFVLRAEGIALKDAPIGGYPNRFFLPMAQWIEKHPTALMWMIVAALHLLGLGVLLIMWPILWRFAESYAAGETWMWMAVLYGFTILSSGLLLYEARLGRNPIALRVMAYGPIMSLYFVALGSEKFGLHLGEGPLRGIADSTPTLMKNLIFLTIASYVGKEIVRRRRLKAAYGERN
nr:DUF4365 domain-containing protein [Streptomyces antimycoticus]